MTYVLLSLDELSWELGPMAGIWTFYLMTWLIYANVWQKLANNMEYISLLITIELIEAEWHIYVSVI